MKLAKLLTLAAISVLIACSSSPSLYPTQEVAYPKREVSTPQMSNKPAEIDEELLEEQANTKEAKETVPPGLFKDQISGHTDSE